jgi:hypothetical protein
VQRQHELALSAYSRANGVQYLAVFGVFWLIGSLTLPLQVSDHRIFSFNVAALAVGAPLAVLVFLWARRTRQATQALATSPANEASRARRTRLFRTVNVAQYLALGLAGLWVSYVHRIDLLVPIGIFVVGAHFLPLALLFKYPFHVVTGLVLIGWSLSYPRLFAGGGWNPVGLSITGIFLLVSACWSAFTASRLATRARTD